MTRVWIAAALLCSLALLVPSLRFVARHIRQRSLQARIRRRLAASVGSVQADRSPALLSDRFRR